MSDKPTISIFGLGRLGLPMAAVSAARGYNVIGVDIDGAKVAAVNRGEAPFFEPDLKEWMGLAQGRLTATASPGKAVAESQISFVFVPTPTVKGGAFSAEYVLKVCKEIGWALRRKESYHLVVIRSTIMPGDTETVVRGVLEQASDKDCGPDFGLCYNPEILALGSVIHDLLHPRFVFWGESDVWAGDLLEGFYRELVGDQVPIVRTSFANAELAKMMYNTYMMTKVTFANQWARICERVPGADVDVLSDIVGLDERIHRSMLTGGAGYGGTCWPRDEKAMAALAERYSFDNYLLEAVVGINDGEFERLRDLVCDALPSGGIVGILGLAFKLGTPETAGSIAMRLQWLLESRGGHTVIGYDPLVGGMGPVEPTSAQDCVNRSAVVVVTLPDKAYKEVEFHRWQTVIDCWRVLDGDAVRASGATYVPLGRCSDGS